MTTSAGTSVTPTSAKPCPIAQLLASTRTQRARTAGPDQGVRPHIRPGLADAPCPPAALSGAGLDPSTSLQVAGRISGDDALPTLAVNRGPRPVFPSNKTTVAPVPRSRKRWPCYEACHQLFFCCQPEVVSDQAELTQENHEGEQVVPAVGAQTMPETATTASNKAANTSSLSIVSIGVTGFLLSRHSLPTVLASAPPKRGQSLPGWGLGLRHPDPAG